MKWSHDKFSAHVTPYTVISIQLTIFPCYPHDYFVSTNVYILIPSPSPFSLPAQSGSHQNVSILFVRFFCSIDSTCQWNLKILSFSVWLTRLSPTPHSDYQGSTTCKIHIRESGRRWEGLPLRYIQAQHMHTALGKIHHTQFIYCLPCQNHDTLSV